MAFIIITVAALLGLYMAWTIGANDVANSMAGAVGSKSLTIKHAIIAAGICEFAGAVLMGQHVTDTIRKGIVEPAAITSIPGLTGHEPVAILVIGMASAILAAACWLHLATWLGMPVSTTHSIVGAIAGFGIIAAGFHCVHWGKIGEIVISWFISPIAGGILAFIFFRLISRFILGSTQPVHAAIRMVPVIVFFVTFVLIMAVFYKGMQHIVAAKSLDWLTGRLTFLSAIGLGLISAIATRLILLRYPAAGKRLPLSDQFTLVEMIFVPLVIITSCTVAFAHGANDVANAIGPLAAIVDTIRTGTVMMKVHVPLWVLVLGGIGIVIGLSTGGARVMYTTGRKITQLTPSRAVAANIAAMSTVLVCTRLKLPVSTTDTLIGAILGIGMARGLSAVNIRVTRNIFGSWFVTVPVAAGLAIVFFLLGRVFLFQTILNAV